MSDFVKGMLAEAALITLGSFILVGACTVAASFVMRPDSLDARVEALEERMDSLSGDCYCESAAE